MKKQIKSAVILCFICLFAMQALPETIGLEQVIREACINSDSVKMMNETVKKSAQSVREQWAAALPKLSASASALENYGSLFSSSSGSSSSSSSHSGSYATKDDVKNAIQETVNGIFSQLSDPQTSTIYSTGLSFSQPIYTFGKVGTALKVAKQYDKAVKCTYQRNMQNIQLQAFDAFFRALIAEKTGLISERTLARKKELNGYLERNFNLGSGSKAQVLSTRADLAGQSAYLLIAKRDALTAKMTLNMLMGRSLTDPVTLDTAIGLDGLIDFPIPRIEDALNFALTQRTDLKSMKLMAESNNDGAKIYKAMYLPSIAAIGSLGYSKMKSDIAMMDMGWNLSWTAGLAVSWTLFDGFSNSAKAAQYKSDANKLEIAYKSITEMVEIEIRSALAECCAADSNSSASQAMLSAAQESYDLTNSNFRQGSGQFADLQLSDETLRQAELGLINAKYRLLRSRAALMVAMGKDIVTFDSQTDK
ncbi:MAG TPA: hypothetical protein DCO75_13080 [Fibrobacteres bacterium]|nr:hypothetical protein [Fibrobacterota bacterium]